MALTLSNFGTYLRSLLPRFKKTDIIVDTSFSFEALQETVIPMFSLYPMPAIVSKLNDLTTVSWRTKIKTFKNSSYATIAATAIMISNNQEAIMNMITKEFNDDNVTTIFDYYKLNILKYIEALNFFNDYSSRWISAVMYETVGSTTSISIDDPTFKENCDYCNNQNNIVSYIAAVNILAMPFSAFLASIVSLKGHTVNPGEWGSVAYNTNGNKLDPHKLNFVPVTWNPFYHGMLHVNTWRVRKHDRNVAELARLQLMVAALSEKASVTEDPTHLVNLEKQIKYYSNEINKLSASIDAMEEEVRNS